MLLAGIQARPELDPRLKHSGVTPLGLAPYVLISGNLLRGNLFSLRALCVVRQAAHHVLSSSKDGTAVSSPAVRDPTGFTKPTSVLRFIKL